MADSGHSARTGRFRGSAGIHVKNCRNAPKLLSVLNFRGHCAVRHIAVNFQFVGTFHARSHLYRPSRSQDQHRSAFDAQTRRRTPGTHHDRFRRVGRQGRRALQAIERAGVIRLSLADQECFAQALLSPPAPSAALKRAFARRSKLLRTV